ncbi:MAG: terpene cyclase/mutase family protein [Oscillospiraceae bacterium]|nr:terpene cyclase/mutase family protein [Oscillospiraceae bacterium]MBR2423094.1 terpene cyclase/mutase family protein [Oscillospiraceae bacterium]
MKKVISVLLIIPMLLAFSGCSGEKASEQNVQTEALPQLEESVLQKTAQWLKTQVPEPAYGSLGGEWLALGMARSELEGMDEYLEGYGERVAAYTAEQGGTLHAKKYTEYSRVILAWTAIGRDASDVGGFNLLLPLADFEQTVFQGLNGPIFALLALDCGDYDIPENVANSTQATREMYVDYILNAEHAEGGWSLAGGPAEADLTAMALQALAKYQDRPDVAEAVARGIAALSEMQNVNGGFSANNSESSESVAQVIVAVTELGIALDDSRFVKNGNTLKDALLRFRLSDGSFSHLMDDSADLLATEQAFYALVAIERMEQGKTSLYSMK